MRYKCYNMLTNCNFHFCGPILHLDIALALHGIHFKITVMLRAISTSVGFGAAALRTSTLSLGSTTAYALPKTTTKTTRTLAEKYEILYQSPDIKEILSLSENDSIIKNILYAERKNKTNRKVAKKHRKKKGKTVNLRRT